MHIIQRFFQKWYRKPLRKNKTINKQWPNWPNQSYMYTFTVKNTHHRTVCAVTETPWKCIVRSELCGTRIHDNKRLPDPSHCGCPSHLCMGTMAEWSAFICVCICAKCTLWWNMPTIYIYIYYPCSVVKNKPQRKVWGENLGTFMPTCCFSLIFISFIYIYIWDNFTLCSANHYTQTSV